MNINEAYRTYSLISRTNIDNLVQFCAIKFLTAWNFHFHYEKLP